jgi:hypothetical protein
MPSRIPALVQAHELTSSRPATPTRGDQAVMPTPRGCWLPALPPIPSGWGLMYGIRWRWWIPRSSKAWSPPQDGPGDVSARTVGVVCGVSLVGTVWAWGGGCAARRSTSPSTAAPRGTPVLVSGERSRWLQQPGATASGGEDRVCRRGSSDGSSCASGGRRQMSRSPVDSRAG